MSTMAVRGKMQEGYQQLQAQSWETVLQKKQFGVVSANFTMPLFTGGKIIAANKAAGIELNEAKVQRSIKEEELVCELVERYYGLVLSNAVLNVRKEVKATMDKHLSDAQQLKSNGMIADAEYLHAKVYASQAEREYKKAVRQQEVINDALLSTLSVDSGVLVSPITPLFYHKNLGKLHYYQQEAQKNSKQLELVALKKNLAHQGYLVERANYMPTLAAMGNYDIANKDLSEHVPEYFVGVGLSWKVFDGTSRMRKAKAAKLKEKQVDEYYQQAELNVNTAVSKYYHELNMQIEQLSELETAQQFAQEYYRVRQQGFTEGMATTTEVADANLALAKVNIEKLQAMYAFDVALSKLLFYSGKLDQYLQFAQDKKAIYSTVQ
jgi:outer membrane protein TolC